ncbi:LysR family transcriptional regulator [Paenibacillus thermotolerans]|uniref:LysR family transcriptional regulator n=1 Tax=Paenibacillus thermotolerans TaxID=3027807 RepID=UPI002367E0CE|nr:MULTISPECIES: LysR family transcriptional regulator [unclassified Paenibacillus]
MNVRHLEIFIEAASAGNISEASKRLHMSQPAVSMQIKRLEEQYGLPFFAAHPKGVMLTDAGQTFLHYAEHIVSLYRQLDRSMNEYKQGDKGYIVAGSPQEIGQYELVRAISGFMDIHPGIEVEIRIVEEANMESLVKRGEIDIGFIAGMEIDHMGCRVTRYKTDHWVLAASITAHARPELPIFTTNDEADALAARIPFGGAVRRMQQAELAKQLAISGSGFAVMLRSAIERELEQGLLVAQETLADVCISVLTRPAEKIQKSLWLMINHLLSNNKDPLP